MHQGICGAPYLEAMISASKPQPILCGMLIMTILLASVILLPLPDGPNQQLSNTLEPALYVEPVSIETINLDLHSQIINHLNYIYFLFGYYFSLPPTLAHMHNML